MVSSLATDGTNLYTAGTCWSVNGQARTNAAAFNLATGELTEWDPQPAGFASGESKIRSISILGDKVFLSGAFTNLNGGGGRYLAAVDKEKGQVLPWAPAIPSGRVRFGALCATDDAVFAVLVNTVVAYDPNDGSALNWTIENSNVIRERIFIAKDYLLVGGNFYNITAGDIGARSFAVFPLRTKWESPRMEDGFSVNAQGRLTSGFAVESSSNLVTWSTFETREPISNAHSSVFNVPTASMQPRQFFRIRHAR